MVFFPLQVLERKGLELIPRDGPPVSEMEALMESRYPTGPRDCVGRESQ